jgi:hypothetical protein
MSNRKIIRLFIRFRFDVFYSGLNTKLPIKKLYGATRGFSSNEFEIIPDVLSSESK